MMELLQRGERPTAAHFGGMDELLARSSVVTSSDFASEFLSILVGEVAASQTSETTSLFAAEIIQAATDDIALNEMLDTVSRMTPLDEGAAKRLFDHLLASGFDRTLATSFRTAALRGALLFAGGSSKRLAKLSGELSYHGCDDDPYFVAHAIRIAGLLYANEPSSGLRDLITASLSMPDVADQTHFELGMIAFRTATDETSPKDVAATLADAQQHFDSAAHGRSSRHDAIAFSCAIGVLRGFYDDAVVPDLKAASARVEEAASMFYNYSAREGWPFDQSRALEVAALTSVSRKVAALSSSMADPIWLEGAATIENELIEAYCANRSVAGGQPERGLGAILRPRIERGVSSNPRHAEMVHTWLRRFAIGAPAEFEPLSRIVAGALDVSRSFTEAADGQPTFVAVVERLRSSSVAGTQELAAAIEQSAIVDALHTSDNIQRILADIGSSFDALEDFRDVARSRFLMICWKLLRFMEHRLDSTAAQDPTGAYLFHRAGEPMPLEKELQSDLLAFLHRGNMPSGDEIRGVAGGRADIEVKIDRHRFIIEVKRELSDASFDNILRSYGAQAKTYQATNVKVGFLFVLDLSKNVQSTPDIENCIQIRRGVLFDDGIDRGMILLRMPGNRIPPSSA
ncbi:hypothetical protein HFO38_24310 [Rhizobium leguminosarum]|uniref:hypothetical protein n=1 Tax=Rhizobium leguminosarum TaxID=384 RepID=UPI001C9433BA|nr:hypothetical protein [Rhizobium leguminosarum]MBY5705801.1 hypothetical protein [Rhizobium leguminosarum]